MFSLLVSGFDLLLNVTGLSCDFRMCSHTMAKGQLCEVSPAGLDLLGCCHKRNTSRARSGV